MRFRRMVSAAAALVAAGLMLGGPADAQAARKSRKEPPETAPSPPPDPATAWQPAVPSAGSDALDVWKDPAFQKDFLGSFGFQAEIEPRVTSVEREQMEKVLPLLSTDQPAAIAELEKVTTADSSAVFDFTLANLHFQQGDQDRAAERYRLALAKFPSFRRAHKNLGLIQVRKGEHDEAIRLLSRVIELGGADGLTFGLLGFSYGATGQYVPAESAFRSAMLQQPELVDWKLGLTQSVLKQRKYGEAVTLCDELIGRYPERADLWQLQANAYIGLEQPLKAAENYEIIRRIGKATPQTLQTLADIYVNESLYDLALPAYRHAVEADETGGARRGLRAVEVLSQRGALEQASALIESVERAHGDALQAEDRTKLLKLKARIAVARGEGGDAVAPLQEIVALDPLDGEALILLGQHFARAGDKEQAIFYFERAQSIDDVAAEASIRHAQVLVELARYREAVPLLRRAQEIRPREEIARYLEQVERIARSGS